MPKKKDATFEANKAVAKEEEEEDNKEKEEDTPLVKELKEMDDKYLAIEREYEAAVRKLQLEFEKKQQPFLDQRKEVLMKSGDTEAAGAGGTPAIPGFWKTALKNHPAFEDQVQEWDEPVLDFLQDITKEHLKEDDEHAGFKLMFHFAENPYFSNNLLWKEYHTAEGSPYTGEMDVKHIKVSEINWKPGKDVTVEKVTRKVKGGGAKKAKQKNKEKEESRPSVFRSFFRELQEGATPPDGIEDELGEDIDPEDLEGDGLMEFLMENDYEAGCSLKDSLIPFAVRWYTGECCDDDDEDDDEDEDSEEDDDEDDDDDSEDDEKDAKAAAGKGKGRGAKPKKGGAKKSPKTSPSSGPAAEPAKTEECKQQ